MDCPDARAQVEDWVRQFASRLFGVAYRLTGVADDAEDLVQETFLIAFRKLEQLRDRRLALAWLYRILRSCWRAWCDRRDRPRYLPNDWLETLVGDGVELAGDIESETLTDALAELPDEYREVLVLFFFEDLRYREIADLVGCPIGTVMSRLARAKSWLRRRLQESAPVVSGSGKTRG